MNGAAPIAGQTGNTVGPDSQLNVLQMDLSYTSMTVHSNGSVMSREEKQQLRMRYGFCTECEGIPTILFNMKKTLFKPLWATKEPRYIEGECAGGICFVCHPDKDPNRRQRTSNPSSGRLVQMPSPSGGVKPVFRRQWPQNATGPESPVPMSPQSFDRGKVSDTSATTNSTAISTSVEQSSSTPRNRPETAIRTPSTQVIVGSCEVSVLTESTGGTGTTSPASEGARKPNVGNGRAPKKPPFMGVFVPGTTEIQNTTTTDDSFERLEKVAEQATSSASSSLNSNDKISWRQARQVSEGSVESSHSLPSQTSKTSTQSAPQLGSHRQARLASTPLLPVTDTNSQHSSKSETSASASNPSLSKTESRITQDSTSLEATRFAQIDGSTPNVPAVESTPKVQAIDVEKTKRELDSLVKEMETSGTSEFLPDIVLGSLREHTDTDEVAAHCLGILWKICEKDAENNGLMMRGGAAEAIIKTMKSHPLHENVQRQGSGVLWSLGVNEHNRIALIREDACSVIVDALERFMAVQDLAEAAIGALRTLSTELEGREKFDSLSASKLTSEAMMKHQKSIPIQRDGCAFLSNCAVNIEKQYVTVVPFDELNAIVQAMTHHKYESSIMQGACFALKNYTFEEMNCRTLRRCKGVDGIIAHAVQFYQAPSCPDDAGEIMERMQMSKSLDESLEDNEYQSLLEMVEPQNQTSRTPQSIVDLMKSYDWSSRLIAGGLQVLHRVVRETSAGTSPPVVLETDIQKDLLTLCRQFEDNESISIAMCSLLATLAEDHRGRGALVDTVDWFSFLFQTLEGQIQKEGLVERVFEALQALSSNPTAKRRILSNKELISRAIGAHERSERVQLAGISIFSLLES